MMIGEFDFRRISESVIYLLLPEEEIMFFLEVEVGALPWEIIFWKIIFWEITLLRDYFIDRLLYWQIILWRD